RGHCPVPLLHSLDMRRRHFLTLSAATLGGVLVYSLDRQASLLASQHKPVRVPLRFFTETEALIVAAAASRIFPSDDSGPGAREAGVAVYIDRQLAGPYGRDRFRYTQPPFEDAPRRRAFVKRPAQRFAPARMSCEDAPWGGCRRCRRRLGRPAHGQRARHTHFAKPRRPRARPVPRTLRLHDRHG